MVKLSVIIVFALDIMPDRARRIDNTIPESRKDPTMNTDSQTKLKDNTTEEIQNHTEKNTIETITDLVLDITTSLKKDYHKMLTAQEKTNPDKGNIMTFLDKDSADRSALNNRKAVSTNMNHNNKLNLLTIIAI